MLDAALVLTVCAVAVGYLALRWYRQPRGWWFDQDANRWRTVELVAAPDEPIYALYCDECGNKLVRGCCPICEEGA